MELNLAAVERYKAKKVPKRIKLSHEFYFKIDKKKIARMKPALPQNKKTKERFLTSNLKYL